MKPGEHRVAANVQAARLHGTMRDVVLILLLGLRMAVVALVRKPLDGAVAETVRQGDGPLGRSPVPVVDA